MNKNDIRIILSNPPWYDVDFEKQIGKLGCRAGSRWPHMRDYKGTMISRYQPFPFFLATATAMLKNDGFDAQIHDSIVIGETYENYYDYLQKMAPDVVLLEISSPSLNNDLNVIKQIKTLLPSVNIVVCGLHAPLSTETFLYENDCIDFAIYGEYEHPFLLLIREMIRGKKYHNVPNLIFRHNKIIYKTSREKLLPMTEFPWPERDTLPSTYYDGCGGMMGMELQLHTSRGCPYKCNFCVLPQVMYLGKYRMREPQDVIKEIEYNIKKLPYTHFYIDDDTINIDRDHFLLLCKLIKESGLNAIPWSCMGRGDLMDEEMLISMKEAGCYSIKYGVESFDQNVLDKTGKKLDLSWTGNILGES